MDAHALPEGLVAVADSREGQREGLIAAADRREAHREGVAARDLRAGDRMSADFDAFRNDESSGHRPHTDTRHAPRPPDASQCAGPTRRMGTAHLATSQRVV